MPTQLCSLFIGIIYGFFGIAGLFPGLVYLPPERFRFYNIHILGHWGYLLGWLPVNPLHNIAYILFAPASILASVTFLTATYFCRAAFALTVLLTITGLLPLGIDRVWGLIPLFGWNIMLHTITAVLCYYYGFIYPLDLGGKEPASEMAKPAINS